MRVLQHTAQFLLPEVAKLIDDLQHQNFHVPALRHQHRLVKPDANGQRFVAAQESDYVDAQEEFTYANPNFPLRNITSGDEQQRLEIAVATLKAAIEGKTIGVAKLKRALTADEYAEFNASCTDVVEQSEIMFGEGMPEQLKSYNKKLNAADFMWARYEAMPTTALANSKRKVKPSEVENRAESLYEDALEDLEQTFSCAARGDWGADILPRLHNWMDRPVDFSFNRTISIDAHGMPRVRGSKSVYAQDSGLPKLSKRIKRQLCALRVLLVAVCEIAFVVPYPQPVALTAAQSHDLKSKLAKLMKRND